MVTRYITNGTLYHEDGSIDKKVECYGLSTDEKPVNVPNSSVFYEMDTGDCYLFDAENSQWLMQ
jgi:hypothetical protein